MKRLSYGLVLAALSLTSLSSFAALSSHREGTQVEISQQEIADLSAWLDNAKIELKYLDESLRFLSIDEKRKKIIRSFESIVERSGKKENELLTRYVLNRAIYLDDLFTQISDKAGLESLVGILQNSIQLALDFYTEDMAYLEAIGKRETPNMQKPLAAFGYEYAEMLLHWSKTFVSPKAEYLITRTALGWLGNDLNSSRNLDRLAFAESIDRIARTLHSYGAEVELENDAKLVRQIRRLKLEVRERILKNVLTVLREQNVKINSLVMMGRLPKGMNHARQFLRDNFDFRMLSQSKYYNDEKTWVMETYDMYSMRYVKSVSQDGLKLLDDNDWYGSKHLEELVPCYENICVGDQVLEKYETYSTQTVLAVSKEGTFFLSDNDFYSKKWISLVTHK